MKASLNLAMTHLMYRIRCLICDIGDTSTHDEHLRVSPVRSVEDYNVSNSEYTRFSNVLARFEADKVVATTKSRDSIQVQCEAWDS